MNRFALFTVVVLVVNFLPVVCGEAQDTVEPSQLVVGTKHSPPFAFKNSDGRWTGISIELWRQLADELNLEFVFRECELSELLATLESGGLDAGVAAISVTAERHRRVEFCHPHFSTGLGIAVAFGGQPNAWMLAQRIISKRLVATVLAMIGIVVCCGLLFWLFERRLNERDFGGRRRHGIGMGIWWSTILLLGHKGVVPASVSGRIVATCAMLASILLLSLLTGVIASVLTVQQLDSQIAHPSDLRHVRVTTVHGSTSVDYLRRRRIPYRGRATAEAALAAVASGNSDAVVYDEALLRYLVNSDYAERVQVLPIAFNTQEYAIALPPDSPLRRPLNEALLRYRASDAWDELLFRYLGR